MNAFSRPLGLLEEKPLAAVLSVSLLTLALIAAGDYFSSPGLSLGIFYVIPVIMAGWCGGMKSGVILSIVTAGVWLAVEVLTGAEYSKDALTLWNSTIHLAFFLVINLLLVELKEQAGEVEPVTGADLLTGLADEQGFLKKVQFENERAKRYSRLFTIAWFDIDNFSNVNTAEGNESGDELLRTVAETLKENLRKTDIIARLHGDKFAVLFSETGYDSAENAIQKCRHYLLVAVEECRWEVTFSVVAVSFDRPFENIRDVTKAEGDLMYLIKKSGKNAIRHIVWGEKEKASSGGK